MVLLLKEVLSSITSRYLNSEGLVKAALLTVIRLECVIFGRKLKF